MLHAQEDQQPFLPKNFETLLKQCISRYVFTSQADFILYTFMTPVSLSQVCTPAVGAYTFSAVLFCWSHISSGAYILGRASLHIFSCSVCTHLLWVALQFKHKSSGCNVHQGTDLLDHVPLDILAAIITWGHISLGPYTHLVVG